MNQKYMVVDYESFSEADLRGKKSAVGAYEYARHPSTRVMCVAWRCGTASELPTAPVRVWSPFLKGQSALELFENLIDPDVKLVAHNAFFEQVITRFVLPKVLVSKQLEEIPHSRWICTASMAAAMALPRSLDGACQALNLPFQKDMEGNRLMMKYCKPRKPSKLNDSTRHNKKNDLLRIMEYCASDIKAETALFLKLPLLNPKERELWELDQKINFRGFKVDRPLVMSVLGMVGLEIEELNQETRALTEGTINSTTRRDAVLKFVNARNANLPDLTAGTIQGVLKKKDLDPTARRLLEIRQDVSKTSTAKYLAMELRSRTDSRIRDHQVYHTASTGRFGGAGVQPHNFPRGTLKNALQATEILNSGVSEYEILDLIRLLYGSPMEVFSSTLRCMIEASPGKCFFGADYNAIEVRVLFWVADHVLGLKAFHDDEDIYRIMASILYRVPLSKVTAEQREMGKRIVLGCLAEDTPVYTNFGFKRIQDVLLSDKLWDGNKWVKHGGVVAKGRKPVIQIKSRNIESTPNHWFRKKGMWRSAVEIVLEEGTIPPKSERFFSDGRWWEPKSMSGRNVVSQCAAYAALKDLLESTNCGPEKQELASYANNLFLDKKVGTPIEIATFYATRGLELVGELVSTTSKNGAKIRKTAASPGMVVEAFRAPSNPLENFWNTLLHSMGLIGGGSLSTELIMIKGMSPEIYESSLKALTTKTVETYDIHMSGPKNRFQVGNSLVHNCGYQMGPDKFQATCLDQYGIVISDDIAKLAVETYRKAHAPVPRLWYMLERAAIFAVRTGKKVKVNHTTWWTENGFLYCELPSKRRLAYAGPEVRMAETPWGEKRSKLYHWGVDPFTRKWVLSGTYGGKLTENVVQAIARDIMAEAMVRCENAGYEIMMTVHDELLTENTAETGSVKELEDLMAVVPEWAVGCPIKVKGWEGFRFRK